MCHIQGRLGVCIRSDMSENSENGERSKTSKPLQKAD